MDTINLLYIILVSLVFGIIVWDINYNNKKGKNKMNRLKKWLKKWLDISNNLDTMLGLIIVNGRSRIEDLEKHKKDIHYIYEERIRLALEENNKQTIERFEAIERRVSKLELINVSCGIDNIGEFNVDYFDLLKKVKKIEGFIDDNNDKILNRFNSMQNKINELDNNDITLNNK